MLNRVVLVGRLTRDPELRYTQQNTPITSFTIAVNRQFSNAQTGEKETDFIPIVVWRKQAENVKKFMQKGSLVGVEGRIQVRTYDDKDGVKRYVTEVVADNVVFLESKGTNDLNSQFQPNPQANTNFNQEDDDDNKYEDVMFASDDLPF